MKNIKDPKELEVGDQLFAIVDGGNLEIDKEYIITDIKGLTVSFSLADWDKDNFGKKKAIGPILHLGRDSIPHYFCMSQWPGPHKSKDCTSCPGGTEEEKLKKALRFAYLTLGFYATEYNYSEESNCQSPWGWTGLNILADKGKQAREAIEKVLMFVTDLKEFV